jgi:hypothetical protein
VLLDGQLVGVVAEWHEWPDDGAESRA